MHAEGSSWSRLIMRHRYARKADGFWETKWPSRVTNDKFENEDHVESES
jgi:hypothetical protein